MTETSTGGVVDVAIERLRERISRGEYGPGSRLPPEATLAEELQLSRLSLREAVRALVMAGVLEVRRGTGTFVTDLRPDKMVRVLGQFLDLSQDRHLGELFECRRVLEPGATALAATRMTDARLAVLHASVERMASLTDPEELVAEDLAFHGAIVAATGNRTLESLAESIAHRTARARIWRALVKEDVASWTHQQHLGIYQALRDRDSLAAFSAAARHVAEVENWITSRLAT
ncbi:FadR/GntR family transcriptional regulator [Amycolatopsis thermophila]|uniref:DNA-binding FadR family transcriptional regulator n=1 Tax=Amycolatopsis thermophila TaxID=206084 RepID=A0ABU0EZC8_9PSEU|nr:FadR/GntR family transcriptional regulator [Amycolatopsis thermophila]MDQ0380675.1 DNA-binding FadR family transcriptional regulator [Amycolatopsis thermophila]